jgi:signal transduction histidine kinase
VLIGRDDRPLALAPEAVRREWMRQYTTGMLVMGGAYEAFSLVRGVAFGFSLAHAVYALLYTGMVILTLVRAPLAVVALYTIGALTLAQIPTFIQLGFTGAAALLPCTIAIVVALFLGRRAAYASSVLSLAVFAAVGFLRFGTRWLPPMNPKLVDPRLYLNWFTLAVGLIALIGPVVWLITKLTVALDESVVALADARSAHDAKARLRVAADEALAKTMDQRHRARRAEASGLLVAGVVHDLRNHLNVLQLWSEALRDDRSADGAVREAAGRIYALCIDATSVTRDVFAVARAPASKLEATCWVGAETLAAGAVLKRALPADFDLTVTSELAEDRGVALDRFALTSTLLELASAAEVTRAFSRRLRLTVREPRGDERATLTGCAAVVELSLGDSGGSLMESLADDVTQRGARLLVARDRPGEGVARLLLPRPPTGDALASSGRDA